jgi:hypothetical protein
MGDGGKDHLSAVRPGTSGLGICLDVPATRDTHDRATGIRALRDASHIRMEMGTARWPSITPSFSPDQPMTSHIFRVRRADDLDAGKLSLLRMFTRRSPRGQRRRRYLVALGHELLPGTRSFGMCDGERRLLGFPDSLLHLCRS